MMKNKILRYFQKFLTFGEIYPKWFLILRFALEPVETIRHWALCSVYDIYTGVWFIGGNKYSSEFFEFFSSISEKKRTFTIERVNGEITITDKSTHAVRNENGNKNTQY